MKKEVDFNIFKAQILDIDQCVTRFPYRIIGIKYYKSHFILEPADLLYRKAGFYVGEQIVLHIIFNGIYKKSIFFSY